MTVSFRDSLNNNFSFHLELVDGFFPLKEIHKKDFFALLEIADFFSLDKLLFSFGFNENLLVVFIFFMR